MQLGEAFIVKAGEVHRFFNAGNNEIKFRNEVHPGHEGFENTLRILYGLASDGLYNDKGVSKDFTHLAVCGIMSDMRLPGLMSLATPLLKFIAFRARKKGLNSNYWISIVNNLKTGSLAETSNYTNLCSTTVSRLYSNPTTEGKYESAIPGCS